MTITQEQYQLIADAFPKHRGTVKVSNRQALNGILYVLEHGLQMAGASRTVRELAHHLHADEPLGGQRRLGPGVPASTARTAHRPRSSGPRQHVGQGPSRRHRRSQEAGAPRPSDAPGEGMNTKIHMIAASARSAVIFALSPGQDHDAPHGRELLRKLGPKKRKQEGEQLELFLVADRAYEGNETRQLAVALGYTPVIPPQEQPPPPMGIQPSDIQATKRGRTALPTGSKATGVSSPATTNST